MFAPRPTIPQAAAEELEKIERLKVGVTGVLAAEPAAPKTALEPGKISGEAELASSSGVASAQELEAGDDVESHERDGEESPVSGASPEGSPPKPADPGDTKGEGE